MLFDEIITMIELILKNGFDQYIHRRKMGYCYQNVVLCSTSYEMYKRINAIFDEMHTIVYHYLCTPMENLHDTVNFSSGEEKWKFFVNRDFETLDRAVLSLLKFTSWQDSLYEDTPLCTFFSCKSNWLESFSETYHSGTVEGNILKRSYLPFARPNDEQSRTGYNNRTFTEEPVITEWDISTYQQRVDIARIAKHQMEYVRAILEEYRTFILRHCTLEMLIEKPSSRGDEWVDDLLAPSPSSNAEVK